jgi:hypothetical protein
MQNTKIGLRRKFLMKTEDCIQTPLMAAFRPARTGRRKQSGEPIQDTLGQFD